MKITNKIIKNLELYESGYNKYLKYYKNKSFTKAQFMELKNLTHYEKVWIASKLMTKESINLAATDIVESVLHIYEDKYSNDDKLRNYIKDIRNNNKVNIIDIYHIGINYLHNIKDINSSNVIFAIYYAACGYLDATSNSSINAIANTLEEKTTQEKLIRKIILKYWK